ncbi:hypothetical protein PAXINDRAFT_14696 [Paxillus involutus ATCC 200175]|uniref:Uncharacterized protein n=1 Tax=Paxillus involutus ATCC 200175 TaxID=664439 RepID=A0A0C9TXZ8_PAXIN|nr:hypothetical protein PAXINDRAFT_14696 [Paxillus involutus ATCC 200175]
MLLALSNTLVIRRDGNNAEDTPTFKCFEFDFQTGSLPAERKHRRQLVHSIAVSPNAKFIASGSWDHQVDSVAVPPGDVHLDGGRYDEEVVCQYI